MARMRNLQYALCILCTVWISIRIKKMFVGRVAG